MINLNNSEFVSPVTDVTEIWPTQRVIHQLHGKGEIDDVFLIDGVWIVAVMWDAGYDKTVSATELFVVREEHSCG